MINVLIYDPEGCCSSIVRCILRGRGFRASVSQEVEEAGRKFETGLFDIVFVDASADADSCALFIESIHETAPGLPILLLHRGAIPAALAGTATFRQIAKPIRVGAVCRAVEQAAQALTQVEHRRTPRRTVDFTVQVAEGCELVTCHATNLSPGGMLVESLPKDEAETQRFDTFFSHEHGQALLTTLPSADGAMLKLTGTVAFLERSQDDHVCHVGIAFIDMPQDGRDALERMLQGAA